MNKRLHRLYFIFFILVSVVLSSCEAQETVTENPLEYSFSSESGQKFTIFRGYKLIEEYIEKVNDVELQQSELDDIYMEIVLNPFVESCLNGKPPTELFQNIIETPDRLKLIELENLINRLKEKNIESLIEEALLDASEILSGNDTTACLMPVNKLRDADGVSYGEGSFIFFYKETSPIVDNHLKSIIAHEYVHSIDPHVNVEEFTILSGLIAEGKAIYVQQSLYPDISHFTIYDDNPELSTFVKDHLQDNDYQVYMFINGLDLKSHFPIHYGYVEGFKIIQSLAERQPELSLNDIIQMDINDVLEQSQYYEGLGL